MLYEPIFDRGADHNETFDFPVSVRRGDVEVHRLLRSLHDVHLLEAELEARSHNDDARVRLGGQAELRQSGDLGVVVRQDLVAIECRSPEPSERRWVPAIDHDLLELPHQATRCQDLSHGAREIGRPEHRDRKSLAPALSALREPESAFGVRPLFAQSPERDTLLQSRQGFGDTAMKTKRLTGRPLTEADIPFVMKVWDDERVTAIVLESMSEQDVRDRIERWSRHRAAHGCGTDLFFDRSSAQPVGWGGLQHSTIGIGECLTIGYAIAPDMWGRGYATEMAVACVDCAFDHLGAHEVRASILATNTQSRRVAEKAGLSLECEISHGEHVEVIYLVDREAWGRGRNQAAGERL